MLSRIAESMFWIGRYVERAEDTARILDVQTQHILEDAATDEETACRSLLAVMGIEISAEEKVGLPQMLDMLAYDTTQPTSMAYALGAARESARGARETLSVPLWEALNTTYRAIPAGQFKHMRAPFIFGWVRDRVAQINGTADATMMRDESWQFLMLGRYVERADMTSRLVATTSLTSAGGASQWNSTLRACGAYDAFLRVNKGVETEQAAAEFLLLDRIFPRSVVHALQRAEGALDTLEGTTRRAGFTDEAHRLIGRMRASLEYRSLHDLLADLPAEMERLQVTCAEATEAVTKRYFAGAEALAWQPI
ncbi:alpha-E domain-containing protein [Nocardioides sp. NPDC057577]|uniref:alpha-E domain-containing protein n=1 Tax=unclassified Nocardioides TaxID=2615069 RepID=UPI0036561453